ncbi:IS30 family transposase [Streptococcus canis]|uniref:IS30 family transposase n=5 Tax=Streptococcus canis TaxID=1329 RepID=UPI0013881F78|nr:IS30 family transposase [Streptococcus canis]QKG74226.1 IS30 family transposase [Streptococcus canis]GFG44755.1 IS30 family transposase [Streptococcus canis]
MQDYYTPKSKQLTLAERRMIDRWLLEGQSNREIARRLAKAPQTIHNEVKRGQVRQQVRQGKYEQVYSADFAQKAYQNNRKRSVKQVSLTKELKEKMTHYIKQKYSPEMMVKAKGVNVPISTIYYWIHHGQLGLTKADRLYPRKEKTKKKQASPNFKPAGKSIEERPESINKREHSGDFEIDAVIQTRAKNECLLTLTDRKSRYQIIRLIPDKSANSVNKALEGILKDYPIRSITADNGTEFSRLSEIFDPENIYYAHPYSSWERGTNENHNRLIRRWLPKGSKNATQQQVAFIENGINNYSKKLLDYKSPKEFLQTG